MQQQSPFIIAFMTAALTMGGAQAVLAQDSRQQIPLQDFCEAQIESFAEAERGNTAPFVSLTTSFTPFSNAEVGVDNVQTLQGPVNISIPASTFVPICRQGLTEWGPQDVVLMDTGSTISSIDEDMDNSADSASILAQRAQGLSDLTLRSPLTISLTAHVAAAHGVQLKIDDGNSRTSDPDSPLMAALKEQALDHLILD